MHQSFVRFPTVGTCVISSPSNKELHAGSSMMITTVCYNTRINSSRTEDKRSQIVNMSLDLLV